MKIKKFYVFFLIILINNCSKLGIDLDPPEIIDYYPHHNSYGIPESASVWIEFSEPMDTVSVENNFLFTADGISVKGKFKWIQDNKKVYFIPDKNLSPGKTYSVSLTRDAKDVTGNSLVKDLLFSFYVGNDTSTPCITSTLPQNLSTNIPVDSDIYIYFSEPMDIKSVQDNFSISPSVNGIFYWQNNNTVLHYHIPLPLEPATRYIVTIDADASDVAGIKLSQKFTFSFITGNSYSIPYVLGVYRYGDTREPLSVRFWTNYQSSISKFVTIAVAFSKPMSHVDTESAFSLTPSVNGSFTWVSSSNNIDTLIFSPSSPLLPDTTYKLSINSTAMDSDGFNLLDDFELHFVVNNTDSHYLKITNITANDGTKLLPDVINEVDLNSAETNTFVIKFNLIPPDKLDISSFQNNVTISRISGWGDSSYSGAIFDISYNPDFTEVYLKLGDLSTNNYYKLSFTGGESGIRDYYQNYMKENIEIIFLTK